MIYLLDASETFNEKTLDQIVDDVRTRNTERGTLVRKEDVKEIRFRNQVSDDEIKHPLDLIAEYREKRARIIRDADDILDQIVCILRGE